MFIVQKHDFWHVSDSRKKKKLSNNDLINQREFFATKLGGYYLRHTSGFTGRGVAESIYMASFSGGVPLELHEDQRLANWRE